MANDESEPGFREVSAGELEQRLRARVSAAPPGTAEQRNARWQMVRFLGMTGR